MWEKHNNLCVPKAATQRLQFPQATHRDIDELGHNQQAHCSANAPPELRVVFWEEVCAKLTEYGHVRHALCVQFVLHGTRARACCARWVMM